MTFTIVAFDAASYHLGVASGASANIRAQCVVVGSVRVGLSASQGVAPLAMHAEEIAGLANGTDPRDVLATTLLNDNAKDQRQILVVDARGRTAAHSGRGCRRLFAYTEGTDHVAAGDNLPSANVVGAMSLSFERSGGDALWERLLLSLESGARAGGDRDGTRAAMLVVYTDSTEPAVELVVDDHEDPIAELRRLVQRRPTGTI